MVAPHLHDTDRRSLAQMFSRAAAPQRLWRPDELADVLQHQLGVSVQFDLSTLDDAVAARVGTLAAADGLPIESFSDLLKHPHPPVELLILAKDFAKGLAGHPDSPLPPEVAQVLYYLAIAAALVRCGRRITSLPDRELRAALAWAIALPWVGQDARELLQAAGEAIEGAARI